MANITLADLTREPTTIELFEHTYRVNAITRSVQKRIEKVQPLLNGMADEEDSDKVIALMADGMDPLLEPQGDAPPAKKVLVEAWKTDRLSLDVLNVLFDKVQEAAVARPT